MEGLVTNVFLSTFLPLQSKNKKNGGLFLFLRTINRPPVFIYRSAKKKKEKPSPFGKRAPRLKRDGFDDAGRQSDSGRVPAFRHAFAIKDSAANIRPGARGSRVARRRKKKRSEKIKRGRCGNRDGSVACGGHYFRCAPRLAELENIILSG